MSGHALPGSWTGTLDDLATLANTLLPQYLPLDRSSRTGSSRTQDEVNPRLIRHYTTQGLLDPPLKEGREARYTRHHLLQLLTLRRLMMDGHSAQALQSLLSDQSDAELEALLTGELRLQVQTGNPALDYLADLRKDIPPELILNYRTPPPSPLAASPRAVSSVPTPARYTRLVLAPGLELHVSRDARLPKTPAEQDALARQIIEALNTFRRSP
jgi:DNA-binding transcriptional MerR regulator